MKIIVDGEPVKDVKFGDLDISKDGHIDIENIVKTLYSAEFWAKHFGKNWNENMPNSIENFDFNIDKSRVLHIAAKNLNEIWEKVEDAEIDWENLETDQEEDVAILRWRNLGLACYYSFTEQSLVSIITAFEAYIKDRIVQGFKNNPRILENQGQKKISIEEILEKKYDIIDKLPEIVGKKVDIDFWNPVSINKTYDKLFGITPLTDKDIEIVNNAFQIRHIIVHNGGVIDEDIIKKTTLTNLNIGDRYVLTREEVERYCNYFKNLTHKIEKTLTDKNV